MQIQRTIQILKAPRLVIDLPDSLVNQRVEVLVITLDENDPKIIQKRRAPPLHLAGRVKELGDVMSSAPIADSGQSE